LKPARPSAGQYRRAHFRDHVIAAPLKRGDAAPFSVSPLYFRDHVIAAPLKLEIPDDVEWTIEISAIM